MKIIGSIALAFLFLVSCTNTTDDTVGDTDSITNPSTASDKKGKEALPVMEFEEVRYEFGEVQEGEFVDYKYAFTNTGDAQLIIYNVRAECGCTAPNDWPKQPVQPGEKAFVSVQFNSQGRIGKQVKRLTITANTYPRDNVVALAGTVIKSNDDE